MKRLCFVLLASSIALGQGVILPPQQALKVVNGITSPVANATITVCAGNTSGIPCAPALVSAVFKDAALTQPLSNPFTTDANGNYSFAMASGTYTVTVTAATFVGYSYQVTVPLAAGANLSFTGSTTFSGPANLNGGGSLIGTFSGPTTFSGNNIFSGANNFINNNAVLHVGPNAYANIAAATAAAGSNVTTIQIDSTYAGTDCPALQASFPQKILYLDYRGPNETTICNQNTLLFGASDAGVPFAGMRFMVQTATGSAMQTPIYGQSIYNNATITGVQGQDGLSGENDVTGTLTISSGSLTMQGGELDNQIVSTGGSILAAVGVIAYNNTRVGSTTPINTATGGRFIGCNAIAGSGAITNCYGVFAPQETAGTTRNYALEGTGPNLAGYGSSAGLAGWDVENVGGTTAHWLYCDSATPQACNVQASSTAGMTFRSSDAGARASYTSTGWSFSTTPVSLTETAAPAGAANTDVIYADSTAHALKSSYNNGAFFPVTQTVASGTATMTTAAIAVGNCGTTVTVAAANVATTDTITWAFNAAPSGQNAGLVAWPTSGNVNFAYCSNTAETPAAATINWRVVR